VISVLFSFIFSNFKLEGAKQGSKSQQKLPVKSTFRIPQQRTHDTLLYEY